jgi:hypothetical protein
MIGEISPPDITPIQKSNPDTTDEFETSGNSTDLSK